MLVIMETSNKIQYLIVDTSAFIKNAALQDIGVNIITEQGVVNEITSKRQLRKLVVLPYDLSVQSAFPENIKFVTEFAKKTGDYTSLSATDVKVIALTYQLEKEKVGTEHLKEAPTIVKTINNAKHNKNRSKPIVGFYMPKKKLNRINETKDKKNVMLNEEEVYINSIEEYLSPINTVNNVNKQENEENEKIRKNQENDKDQKYDIEKYDKENMKKYDNENMKIENMIKKKDEEYQEYEEDQEDEDDRKDELLSNVTESSDEYVSDYETATSDMDYDKDIETVTSDMDYDKDIETATSDMDYDKDIETEDLTDKFSNLYYESAELEVQSEDGNMHDVNDILTPMSDEKDEDTLEQISDFEDDCNNDSDWITPSNIKNMKKQMDSDILKEKSATVACLTMDFAMQNVLMQIGLNIASLDGKVIKQMRTFIFRCYACFKTTSIMTKVFCPNCGNKTLKKVAISLDDNGKQQIHINVQRPLSARGKKFSLPTPQGGKHANNPILCEDQPLPQQRVSKLARTKNNPLYEDYIAGFSPFVTRDVYSKSAMLGVRSNGGVKYWMKRNPNESRRK